MAVANSIALQLAALSGHKKQCVKYERTSKKGFLMRAYRNMQSRVMGIQWVKFHLYAGKSIMPREEFYEWSLSDPAFHALWDAWQAGDCQRVDVPSVDRIDAALGYVAGNVRWVRFAENCKNIQREKTKRPKDLTKEEALALLAFK